MPGRDFYHGTLAARVRQLGDHHFAQPVRHISQAEYEVLLAAADQLDDRKRPRQRAKATRR